MVYKLFNLLINKNTIPPASRIKGKVWRKQKKNAMTSLALPPPFRIPLIILFPLSALDEAMEVTSKAFLSIPCVPLPHP